MKLQVYTVVQLYTDRLPGWCQENILPTDVAMSDDFSAIRAAVINALIEKGVFIAAGKSCRSCMSERFSIWELATALAFFLCHYSTNI